MSDSQKSKKKLALFLIFGPVGTIVVSIILYAIANFIIGSSVSYSGENGSGQPVITTVINIVLFLLGAVSILALIPCLIIGIILIHRQNNPTEMMSQKIDPETRIWEDLD